MRSKQCVKTVRAQCALPNRVKFWRKVEVRGGNVPVFSRMWAPGVCVCVCVCVCVRVWWLVYFFLYLGVVVWRGNGGRGGGLLSFIVCWFFMIGTSRLLVYGRARRGALGSFSSFFLS